MSRRPVASVETAPEIDRLALKFAKLQPKVCNLDGGGGGSTADRWKNEDAATIAAAIGSYVQNRPRHRFPAMLLMLRLWPEGLNPGQVGFIQSTTTHMLIERYGHLWDAMPGRVQDQLSRLLLNDERLTVQLLDEFRAPSPCAHCGGRGLTLRTTDEEGNHVAPIVVTCPTCNGVCEAPRSPRLRARVAGFTHYLWMQYVQPTYERTLSDYRYLSDRAGAGVLARLG